jgi:hypothetical protein
VFLYVPPGHQPHFDFLLASSSARLTHVVERVWQQEIVFSDTQHAWSVPFGRQSK